MAMGKIPKRQHRQLFLAEWIEATGHQTGAVASAAGVDQSYISNIIAGRKGNPSAHVLLAVSEHLGVTVNDLYRRPPPTSVLEHLSSLSPAARTTLSGRRRT
jgi:transcriptional regulator with XRE-family HTH domain